MKEELGYIDEHFLNGKIKVLHPLKDFLTNEVLIYNYIYNLPVLTVSSGLFPVLYNSKNLGTHFIISSFFNALQGKMASTINTVVGWAERLRKEKKVEETKEKKVEDECLNIQMCSFCYGYRDNIYNKMEIGSIDEIEKEYINILI